jgi:Xaa-Pro dipeptidase
MSQAVQLQDDVALVLDHIDVLSRRYSQALEACKLDAVVVLAGPRRLRTRDDQPYPFRPDPYFTQWLPLADAADSAIEFVPGCRPRLLCVRDEDFWHEPPQALTDPWSSHFAIDVVTRDEITRRLQHCTSTTAIIGDSSLRSTSGKVNDPALLARLDFDRAIKTARESACMAAANRIAVRGHTAVAAAFAGERSEFDMHVSYTSATRLADAELPYPTIIAVNEHAATLHYQNRRKTPAPQTRSLLIDAGAMADGYAADISRTYAREAGAFTELIESINVLQQTLCGEARAGVDYVELNDRAHLLLASVLAEHGIVTCSAEAAYETGITTTFLPHGLGHLLGIQVHDVGGHLADPSGATRPPPPQHPYLRLTRQLEPGFVVTIEPGIYFIPSLLEGLRGRSRTAINWLRVEALVPFGGVRIEDNVLVESAGVRNLTREAFADVA